MSTSQAPIGETTPGDIAGSDIEEELIFVQPGRSKGVVEIFRHSYLTSLLVHKELRVRYRGSVLGMLWSYAKPATQFLVFYFAIGIFMGMHRSIPNYVIYMFSGVVLINYFSESFSNATRSVIANAPLVKKIYLPRQLFPLSSTWVAVVHFLPQLLILVLGAFLFGWAPGWANIGAILLGLVLVSLFAVGIGLIGASLNVLYRDTENFVDLILMIATWISPVLYSWQMVHDVLADGWTWLWYVYQLNPMTVAIELFHFGFWSPTRDVTEAALPPDMTLWVLLSVLICGLVLIFGEWLFRRLDPRFAQEL